MAFKSEPERYLVISDLQIPYHHPKSFQFLEYLVKTFRIPKDSNILCVGDELDAYWGGMWEKSIEASHTANQEIEMGREVIKELGSIFPRMKICISNHGSRWIRKALQSQIPSQMIRDYKQVFQIPEHWHYEKRFLIETKIPFIVEHGDDHGGSHPHLSALQANGISTMIGHHHTKASITFVKNAKEEITNQPFKWGGVIGSLIDYESYVFDYGRSHKNKPVIGTGVVLDNGRLPIFCPIE